MIKNESGTTLQSVSQLSLSTSEKSDIEIPEYLQRTYWWAYLHPVGVNLFERQWLVNLILWGNFNRLRNSALDEIGSAVDARVLQVACVYGDFTEKLLQRLDSSGHLDVVDVAPIQLTNLDAKLKHKQGIDLHVQDSSNLQFNNASFDSVVVFFLLHEQPEQVREKTIAETLRVVKPGGKVIFVDYHRPKYFNPIGYFMVPVLKILEPFAMDLWQEDIEDWLPEEIKPRSIKKYTIFSGLYQKVVIEL